MKRPRGAAGVQHSGDKPAGKAVEAARARFNDALADRDFAAIAAALSEEVSLVPGDEAAPILGRDAQLAAWKGLFDQAPDCSYLRTPARIDIEEDGQLAAETGRWRGGWSAEGVAVRYSGRYFAKWRNEDGVWRIEAEIFVTLKRDLSRC